MAAAGSSSKPGLPSELDIVQRVRRSTAAVVAAAKHVSLGSPDKFAAAAEQLAETARTSGMGSTSDDASVTATSSVDWDAAGWHYCADAPEEGPLTCQYVFVLDTLNWCFWPSSTGLEYDHLAVSLKHVLEADPTAFDAENLRSVTAATIQAWLAPHDVPQLEERAIMIRELGEHLETAYGGVAASMVAAAEQSGSRLVSMLAAALPGFRDEAIYGGRRVFLYKRAQILVADLWAAYGRRTSGLSKFAFRDVESLTMFADYRVPQLLLPLGVLCYSEALRARIEAKEELPAGGEAEVEIRAASVVAVEQLRVAMGEAGMSLLSVELDWLLWQQGEKAKDELPPHHRTHSVCY